MRKGDYGRGRMREASVRNWIPIVVGATALMGAGFALGAGVRWPVAAGGGMAWTLPIVLGAAAGALIAWSGCRTDRAGAAEVARIVAEKDYRRRLPVPAGGGGRTRLAEAFNHLLAEIEARDAELHAVRSTLERRVEERTAALREAQELALREQARFQFIFESVPVGISYHSGKKPGQPLTSLINDEHLRICGVTREQAKDVMLFKRITHPDDAPRQAVLDRQLERGEIERFAIEKRYVRPDGRVVWVAFCSQRKKYEEGRFGFLTTVVDVTAQKEAQEIAAREEARFKFIFESVPFGIAWMLSGQPASRIVNPAFARVSGVPVERCKERILYARATHPEDKPRQDELQRRLLAGEIDRYALEKRYLHPDGTMRWAALTVRFLKNAETGDTQEISTLLDITERRQAEEELAEANRRLFEASHRAGMAEVATGVLHNVGNVLNSVNVSARLVAEQMRQSKAPNLARISALLDEHAGELGYYLSTDPQGRVIPSYLAALAASLEAERMTIVTELEQLWKNIDHIKDIVSMQQDYAKVSSVAETIEVIEVVEDALRMNAGALERHKIELGREYQARPVMALDKQKLLQILVNLVRNAKYACEEANRTDRKVTVRVTADEKAVTIAVVDNGVGIPPENLTRIFAHGFTTRPRGHGFGLHSSALAARELGGTLAPYSAGPGRGATFTLTLPLSRNPDHAQPIA